MFNTIWPYLSGYTFRILNHFKYFDSQMLCSYERGQCSILIHACHVYCLSFSCRSSVNLPWPNQQWRTGLFQLTVQGYSPWRGSHGWHQKHLDLSHPQRLQRAMMHWANVQLLPSLDTVQGLLISTINIIKATPERMPRASQETLEFVKSSTLFITGTDHIRVLYYPILVI